MKRYDPDIRRYDETYMREDSAGQYVRHDALISNAHLKTALHALAFRSVTSMHGMRTAFDDERMAALIAIRTHLESEGAL